jgi:hypothetical protein
MCDPFRAVITKIAIVFLPTLIMNAYLCDKVLLLPAPSLNEGLMERGGRGVTVGSPRIRFGFRISDEGSLEERAERIRQAFSTLSLIL